MGPIVRLFSLPVGMAAEAMARRKAEKARLNSDTLRSEEVLAGPSTTITLPPDGDVPRLIEVSDDKTAKNLVQSGHAELTSRRGSMISGAPLSGDSHSDSDSDSSDSENDEDEVLNDHRDEKHSGKRHREDDEQDWALDESMPPPTYEQAAGRRQIDNNELVADVMHATSNLSPPNQAACRLPCPVILPQRRPGNRTRGFVRAYAPVLNDCGIDQETFIRFIDNFEKSSQASPIFNIINIASDIAGAIPEATVQAVSIGLKIASKTAQELQTRHRTNTFLDQMNTELFQPHGLYAMLFKYQPRLNTTGTALDDIKIGTEIIDFNHTTSVSKYNREGADTSTTTLKDKLAKIRLTSGETHGELEMPAAAPLIFPAVDAMHATSSSSTPQQQSAAQRSSAFLADYFDRRARATAAYVDPKSTLVHSGPEANFHSALADPNHPAFRGSFVTLLSGGKIAPKDERKAARREAKARKPGGAEKVARKAARREAKAVRKEARIRAGERVGGKAFRNVRKEEERLRRMGVDEGTIEKVRATELRKDRRAERRDLKIARKRGAVKRYLKMNIVYLMIVNMPSAEELDYARQRLAEKKA